MNKIELYKKSRAELESLYKGPGRTFLNHLIGAFILEEPTYIPFTNKKIASCITGEPLNTLYSIKGNPCKDQTIISLIQKVMNDKDDIDSSLELRDKLKEVAASRPEAYNLAMRSDHSCKLLSTEDYQALKDLVSEHSNDKKIKSMLHYINRSHEPLTNELIREKLGDFMK